MRTGILLAALVLLLCMTPADGNAATPVEEFSVEAKVSTTRLNRHSALRIHSIRVVGVGIERAKVTVRCRASRRNCKRLRGKRVTKVRRQGVVEWRNVNWVMLPRNGVAVKVGSKGKVGRFANVGPSSAEPEHLVYKRVGCIDRRGKAIDCPNGTTVVPGQEVAPQTSTPSAPTPVVRVLTVDNRVTNGMGMREDPTPVRLLTKTWIRCGARGCNINGTERVSGGTYDAAICQTTGERTTNGHDTDSSDDANPLRFESTRYYGVRLSNGVFGYVNEVWIAPQHRGGLGLPGC